MTTAAPRPALPLFQDNDPVAAPSPGVEEKMTPMMAQYWAVKKQHPDALVFYRMGDFFELFFEDAVTAAPILDIALTRRGKQDEVDVPMCGVPVHAYESYVAKLIQAGFKVALCDQTETPEQAKERRGAKALVTREVTRIITPGTVTEENLLQARRAHYLAAVTYIKGQMGVAWLDLSTGAFMTEAVDVANLPATLARIAPREILVPERLYHQPETSATLRLYDRAVTVQPDSVFHADNAALRLKQHYQTETLDAFGTFAVSEVTAAGVLLDYVERTQRAAVMHLQPPIKVRRDSLLQMDAATRRNLELSATLGGERRGSLLETIDHTLTSAGGRLLARRLQEPVCNVAVIAHRLDQVEFMVMQGSVRDQMRALLPTVPDMERALARLALKRGTPRDLGVIRDALYALQGINQILQSLGDVPEAVRDIIMGLRQPSAVQDMVDVLRAALVDAPPINRDDGGFVRPGFHAGLDQARHLRDDGRRLMLDLQQRYIRETGIETLKITHNNILGYFIEVSAKRAEVLFQDSARFIHRQTMANAVRFTTTELNQLQRDVLQAGAQSLAIEQQIFDDLTAQILSARADLVYLATMLATLDVACALAHLAVQDHYVRPLVDDSSALHIVGGRHPVVEAALRATHQPFMANNADLSPARHLWLLTGPNMAGKSTFLRQNALIILLAQMGSFVPAASAHIGVVDRLFSRVGASDDLAKGQSTFMVEMVETAAILNQATAKSFVILDEIGRGTATFDGLAIAWAVLEYLHDHVGCRGLFATHYHELTSLSSSLPQLHLATMSVKEWQNDIVFLHTVVDGVAAGSYGIHVARLAGLPVAVTARAEQVLQELDGQDRKISVPAPIGPDTRVDPRMDRLLQVLGGMDVDALSPREALEKLYELKNFLV